MFKFHTSCVFLKNAFFFFFFCATVVKQLLFPYGSIFHRYTSLEILNWLWSSLISNEKVN